WRVRCVSRAGILAAGSRRQVCRDGRHVVGRGDRIREAGPRGVDHRIWECVSRGFAASQGSVGAVRAQGIQAGVAHARGDRKASRETRALLSRLCAERRLLSRNTRSTLTKSRTIAFASWRYRLSRQEPKTKKL